jgi:predicted RNase H-like HicB family nuclease
MKKKILKFTVVFEKAEEGGYIVSVPALPGCMSQGETFEEAETMIKDAIECYCSSLAKHKEFIPKGNGEIVGMVSVPVAIGK